MIKFSQFAGVKKPSEVNERSIKFEALDAMKEIQSTLASVSLLSVLEVMRPENPLREEVLAMEKQLFELSSNIGQFISDNIADAEEDPEDDQEPTPEDKPKEDKPEKKEEKPKDKPKNGGDSKDEVPVEEE